MLTSFAITVHFCTSDNSHLNCMYLHIVNWHTVWELDTQEINFYKYISGTKTFYNYISISWTCLFDIQTEMVKVFVLHIGTCHLVHKLFNIFKIWLTNRNEKLIFLT